ncbi:MAG: carbohydrate ABC transporter permease [Acidimicrobiales bacterium]
MLVVIAVVTLYPLALLVSTALERPGANGPGISFAHALSGASFSYAWTAGHFSLYMRNTAVVTIAVVIIGAIPSILGAYGIALLRLRGARMLLNVAILGLMLPTEALIIPWYYQLRNVGLLNTVWGMVLPQAAQGVAFGLFWMTTAFRAFPVSLVEAAELDGASKWTVLWRVAVPNLGPAIRTMVALTFLWTWNSFLVPLVMISDPSRYVVTVGLSTFQGARFNDYGALAAGSILAAAPVIAVYLLSQRSFITGMFAGSVVE